MAGMNWKLYLVSRVFIAIGLLLAPVFTLMMVVRRPFILLRRTKRRTSPPDCMLDPTLGKHQYVQANGIKFHYVTCGDPSKPLMLCLHGFPECWYSWRHQLKEFSADYHVVAVDLRGYNETERPPNVLDYTIANIRQDIVELIPALGHEKAILVGNDWGGGMVWNVAGHNPEVVDKLIVLNAPHPKVMLKSFEKLSTLLKTWYSFFFQVPYLPECLLSAWDFAMFETWFHTDPFGVRNKKSFTAEDVEAYKYVYSEYGARTAPINYYRANFMGGDLKSSMVGTISVPSLLIWGDNDAIFDPSVVDGHDGSVVTDLTVRRIQDCSHWVQNDNPERVNQHMREFLENAD